VRDAAKLIRGKETGLVTENQSNYIPFGEAHALKNLGVIPLKLVEVQSGNCFWEDDSKCFEEQYGRA
jgi:mannose-6-phosphate isomerase-like protein (cupin superfamily)